jgi:DNA ligase (NAD+)
MNYTHLSTPQQLQLYTDLKIQYYEGNPTVSDAEFDEFEAYLFDKLGVDNPAFKIGASGDYDVKHDTPMLSLNKFKEDEFDKLVAWMGNEQLVGTYKMDGTAGSLIYENGVFVLAKTRGDGISGKNITKASWLIDFPKQISDGGSLEIRGEFVISRKNFDNLKLECSVRGLEIPSSMRNIVAGLLNANKKHDIDLAKFISFCAYDLIDDIEYNEDDKLKILQILGFRTASWTNPFVINDENELRMAIEEYKEKKDSNWFLTDGLVFSYRSYDAQKNAGMHKRYPKGKMAYKMISETAETVVKDLEWTTTRTGKVSVVAIVEPVEISEATIQRVSMFNAGYIRDNNIAVGDTIKIVRSGEIIPKYLETVKKGSENSQHPLECPSCNSSLEWSDTQTDLYCKNPDCPAQAIEHIIHWCKVLEFDKISGKTIEALWDAGLIRTIKDMYNPEILDKMIQVNGLGTSIAKTLSEHCDRTATVPISKFLQALGLPAIGQTMSGHLAEKFGSLENLLAVNNVDDLEGLPNAAIKTKFDVLNALETVRRMAKELRFIVIEDAKKSVASTGSLSGKNFLITGSVEHPKKRKGVEEDIINAGGLISSSVNATLDYLVINESKGSSKEQKAEALGVKMITEKELYKMIGE